MGSDRWHRISEVFEGALQRPVEQREAYLESACDGDSGLRQAVETLLDVDQQAEGFLSTPLLPSVDAFDTGAELEGHFGNYRILERLGEGGMSTVYLAVRNDDTFDRRVAIKLIQAGMENAESSRRLRTERQILASLDHPNIAKLFDAGTTAEGRPYFVMELIEGLPISEHCERYRLSTSQVLELFQQVCSAVEYAHRNLVVHRDIKPSNLLVTPDGKPKLLDFGIAKLLDPELVDPDHEPTATWQRLMTPHYASPEQIRGEPITTASDVYSLGVMLYRLLTGRLPFRFDNRSTREMSRTLTESVPMSPSAAVLRTDGNEQAANRFVRGLLATQVARDLRGDLDHIVLKAIRSSPHQRYSSVEQLWADIDRHVGGFPVLAAQGQLSYRLGKLVRRHWRPIAVGATVFFLLLTVAVTMTFYSARLAEEHDQKATLLQESEANKLKLETVNSFVVELFRWADPFEQGGHQVTVLEALENSESALSEAFVEQPELEALLRYTRGRILFNLGLDGKARQEFERALKLYEGLGESSRQEYAEVGSHYGLTFLEAWEFDTAEPWIVGALDSLKTDRDAPSPQPLPLLNNLVTFHCYRGTYEQADAASRQALELARHPDTDPTIALDAINNRAMVSRHTGDLRGAARLYEEGIQLQQRLGGETPAVATLINNHSELLEELGEIEEAEQGHRRALDLRRRLLKDSNYEVSQSLYHLAVNLRFQGRLEEAEVEARQAYKLYSEWEGAGAYTTVSIAGELARIQLELGKLETAERFLVKNLETVLPPEEPGKVPKSRLYLPAKTTLGAVLTQLGHHREAERHLTEARSLAEEVENRAEETRILQELLGLYELSGRAQESESLHRRFRELSGVEARLD